MLSEDRKVNGFVPTLDVAENISLARLDKVSKNGILKYGAENQYGRDYIKELSIKVRDEHDSVANLSGGNQQKVVLSKWLMAEPDILLLDEPTRGIDVGAKAEIEVLIQELSDMGISILMISSEIAELERNCDRVVVMRDGRAVGEVIDKDINQNKIMELIAKGSESEGMKHD